MRILPDFARLGNRERLPGCPGPLASSRCSGKAHRYLGVIFICCLSAVSYGCGRKVFPKPIGAPPPPKIHNLSARVQAGAVVISWSPILAAAAGGIHYSIMKSDISWQKRNCLECPPPTQQLVKSIEAATAKPAPDGRLRWKDSAVSYRRAYRYQIALINDQGVAVSLSNPVIAKVYPGPVAPVDLTAITQQHGILLRWKQTPEDLEGMHIDPLTLSFRVQRFSGAGSWTDISPLVKGQAYYDQEISPGQSYTYRVVPVRYMDGENVYGAHSAAITAMGMRSAAPPPPERLWVTPTQGGLEVHWIEAKVKIAGYYVYRKQGKQIIRLTAGPVLHSPYVDHGVSRAVNCYYAVSAVSATPKHKEGLLSRWVGLKGPRTR